MGLFRKEHSKVEAADIIIEFGTLAIRSFMADTLPDLCNDLDIRIGSLEIDKILGEVIILHYWATNMALAGDDPALLDLIRDRYMRLFANGTKHIGDCNAIFIERTKRYCGIWQNDYSGVQMIWATDVLCVFFNNGIVSECFINFDAGTRVQTSVISLMIGSLNLRKKFIRFKD